MRNSAWFCLLFCALCVCYTKADVRTPGFSAIDAAGDSVLVGVDAAECTYVANPPFGWMGLPKGVAYNYNCAPPSTSNVFNLVERVNCTRTESDPVIMSIDNHAVSGATMIGAFYTQAVAIRASFASMPVSDGQRLIVVLMGHNDYCSGKVSQRYSPFWPFKQNCNDLPNASDRDPDMHCSSYVSAFEREFRRGLDQLVQIPNVKIAVVSPGRISQLCNMQTKVSVIPGVICAAFWGVADFINSDICSPLTGTLLLDGQCSDGRVGRAYSRLAEYRSSLFAVAAEYNSVPSGGVTPTYTFKGVSAGGATKAAGVVITNSDMLWKSRTVDSLVSACDCFHPSAKGQSLIAQVAANGFQCGATDATQCCANDNDALTPVDSGFCRLRDTQTFIPPL